MSLFDVDVCFLDAAKDGSSFLINFVNVYLFTGKNKVIDIGIYQWAINIDSFLILIVIVCVCVRVYLWVFLPLILVTLELFILCGFKVVFNLTRLEFSY